MSLFSSITGFNANTIKEFANTKETKAEDEKVDYSNVDYCVGNNYNNTYEKEDNVYKSYDSEYEVTSKYLNYNKDNPTIDFNL